MIDSLRLQIRRYFVPFIAVAVVMLIGVVVGALVIAQQRFHWPWEDFYEVSAEFRNAQAVTPGQGQSVHIAGVVVGDVKSVELDDGVAVVTVQIEKQYAPIYRNAQMTLRPRTAAKDMSVALDPGTPSAGEIPDGGRLPVSNTEPDINTDEVFSALDTDTRTYLRLLISGLGEGTKGNRQALRRILLTVEPTTRQTQRITHALAGRRHEIARLVHNLDLLTREVARKDEQVSTTIDATGATLGALARQDTGLRESLRRLPGTLGAAEPAFRHGRRLAEALAPAAAALRPPVRRLAPSLDAARPLLAEATPILRRRVRPLVRDALPVVADLRPAARDLRPTARTLPPVVNDVNHIVNELVYDPPGPENGYLFYLDWFAHNLNSVVSSEDAHGAFARGLVVASCSDLLFLQEAVDMIPGVDLTLPDVTTLPECP